MSSVEITAVKMSVNVGVGTFTTDMSTLAGTDEHSIIGIDKNKKIAIHATNTTTVRSITIKASDFGVALGQGDIDFSLPQDIPMAITVEGSRIVNKDGSIEFTVAAGMTGSLDVFELPD